MLVAKCSIGVGEWSDACEVLSVVGSEASKSFTLQYIQPLLVQIYTNQGNLKHANEVCGCGFEYNVDEYTVHTL